MLPRRTRRRGLRFLDRREKFLPLKPAALEERMLADGRLSTRERTLLQRLFKMIAARFHMEFRERLERLKTVYEPFDPDIDTVPADADGFDPQPGSQPAAEVRTPAEFEELGLVLEIARDANYEEMPRRTVLACAEFQARRDIVVHASLGDYAELRVFYRGIRRETREFHPWYSLWRRRSVPQHVLSRVALLVRLARQPDAIYLKLFKNVVAEDLEMLLPYVRIHMKLFDQLKIGSSVVGGLATAAWKASSVALSPWVALAIGTGFAGSCVRGVTGFFSTRTRYMHALTANLYFQNLANNASMMAHVIDAAEAEQCKELLLAYFLLYVERASDFTQEQLDRRAEQWLADEFHVRVDFDVHDAVQKLVDKKLVVRQESVGDGADASFPVLKVFDLPSSLRRLDEAWDDCFEEEAEPVGGGDRIADASWPPYAA